MDDLLRASFDATIWCDTRFFILDCDEKAKELFASLIPETRVKRGLRSLSLFDLIATDDRPRFKQYIRHLSTNASLFHTDLTCDQKLCADIYITCSGALARQGAHLVGIRISRSTVQDSTALSQTADFDWECSYCHCVNNSPNDSPCILCGETPSLDY